MSTSELTLEQRERIEANRRLALERRQQALARRASAEACAASASPCAHKSRLVLSQHAPSRSNERPQKEADEDACAICYEGLGSTRALLDCCTHTFHHACIMEWVQRTNKCPLCVARVQYITHVADCKVLSTTRCQDREQRVVDDDATVDLVNSMQAEEWGTDDDVCEMCGSGADESLLLVCDSCDGGYCHTYCCDPPLVEVPDGEWLCETCARGAAAVASGHPQRARATQADAPAGPGRIAAARGRLIVLDDSDDEDHADRIAANACPSGVVNNRGLDLAAASHEPFDLCMVEERDDRDGIDIDLTVDENDPWQNWRHRGHRPRSSQSRAPRGQAQTQWSHHGSRRPAF